MADVTGRRRQVKGTPIGGQFAQEAKKESDLKLSSNDFDPWKEPEVLARLALRSANSIASVRNLTTQQMEDVMADTTYSVLEQAKKNPDRRFKAAYVRTVMTGYTNILLRRGVRVEDRQAYAIYLERLEELTHLKEAELKDPDLLATKLLNTLKNGGHRLTGDQQNQLWAACQDGVHGLTEQHLQAVGLSPQVAQDVLYAVKNTDITAQEDQEIQDDIRNNWKHPRHLPNVNFVAHCSTRYVSLDAPYGEDGSTLQDLAELPAVEEVDAADPDTPLGAVLHSLSHNKTKATDRQEARKKVWNAIADNNNAPKVRDSTTEQQLLEVDLTEQVVTQLTNAGVELTDAQRRALMSLRRRGRARRTGLVETYEFVPSKDGLNTDTIQRDTNRLLREIGAHTDPAEVTRLVSNLVEKHTKNVCNYQRKEQQKLVDSNGGALAMVAKWRQGELSLEDSEVLFAPFACTTSVEQEKVAQLLVTYSANADDLWAAANDASKLV